MDFGPTYMILGEDNVSPEISWDCTYRPRPMAAPFRGSSHGSPLPPHTLVPVAAGYSFPVYFYGYAGAVAHHIKYGRQLAQRLQPFHIVGIRLHLEIHPDLLKASPYLV